MKRRAAFTLLEMSVSLALVAILVVALGSALLLTAKVAPAAANAPNSASEAARALSPIADELSYALTMPVRQANTLEFTVPDRTGDGLPEIIRYAWAGTAGAPLTRQCNGGAVAAVLPHAFNVQLAYEVQPLTRPEVQTTIAGAADAQLAYFDGWSGYVPATRYFAVSNHDWVGQYVALNLPADCTRLVISKVRVRVKSLAALGQMSVGIYPAVGSDPLPAADPYGSPCLQNVPAPSAFDSWRDFAFTDVAIPNPTGKLFILAKATAATPTFSVTHYYNALAPGNGTWLRSTSDSGAAWGPASSDRTKYDVRYLLYGSYQTSRDQVQGVTRQFVRRVELTVQTTDSPQTRVQTAVAVANDVEAFAP